MAETGFALGQLKPVLYFEDSSGRIMLPPTDEDAYAIREKLGNRGYMLREAGSLPAIDKLQKRLQEQEYSERQSELEREEQAFGAVRKAVRERLLSRMISKATTEYEKDFIRAYLMLREDKREKYQKLFMADQAYFIAREFDNTHARIDTLASRVPDGGEVACTRCGEYRRLPGKDICARCNGGLL